MDHGQMIKHPLIEECECRKCRFKIMFPLIDHIINWMLQRAIQLKINPNCKQKQVLSRNQTSDLLIMIGSQIFPLNRQYFQEIKYISTIPHKERVHIIQHPLDAKICSNIFSLVQGSRIIIRNFKELEKYLNVIEFLQFNIMKEKIEEQLKENLGELQIFPVIELAYKYGLSQLFKSCMETLINEQFEQINYNRFEFIQCNFTLFQIILRRHHCMKISKQIEGLNPDMVEEVIRLYCLTNKYNQETCNKLLDKYVKSLLNPNLLRFDEFLSKKVLKSEIYENDADTNADSVIQQKKKSKQRKYSCEVERTNINWFKFGETKKEKRQLKHLQTLKSIDFDVNSINSENEQKYEESLQKVSVDVHDKQMCRISGLIDRYYDQCKVKRQTTKQDDSDWLLNTAKFKLTKTVHLSSEEQKI